MEARMPRSARTLQRKATYSRPTLTVYGGLTKLTATGTITTGENAGSMVANMA
jgi:hypothetical protein